MTAGIVSLAFIALLIAANAFFVAAEFALVSLRRPVVLEGASAGDRRARVAARELTNLSFVVKAAQFGIALTTLLVGFLIERAVGPSLLRPALTAAGFGEQGASAVSLVLAWLVALVALMMFGVLLPERLALTRPLQVALVVTGFTRGFGLVFRPLIRTFDWAGRLVTERLLRLETVDEVGGGRTLDELARIIDASKDGGSLSDAQSDVLRRAVELGDRRVVEVMIPRPDVVSLPAEATLADLRDAARRTGHSRFPVVGVDEDDIVGTVHVKDLISVDEAKRDTIQVGDIARPLVTVPESESLRNLLTDLRRRRRTYAVVVDEHGGTAGIVTLEDVLEELVGDIEDEFDRHGSSVRRLGPNRFLVRGTLRADRVEELLQEELPEGEYETFAGFVLDQLGHIPKLGEAFTFGRLEIRVHAMQNMRITDLLVRVFAPSISARAPHDRRSPGHEPEGVRAEQPGASDELRHRR